MIITNNAFLGLGLECILKKLGLYDSVCIIDIESFKNIHQIYDVFVSDVTPENFRYYLIKGKGFLSLILSEQAVLCK